MSAKNVALVERFYELLSRPARPPGDRWTAECLAEAVDYSIVVAKTTPIQHTFGGRREVENYLNFLFLDYQIVEAMPTTFTESRNTVIANGGEVAHMGISNELVQTKWIAVYEIENELITKVWMSVHSWTVLVAGQDKARRTMHSVMKAYAEAARPALA